MAYDVILIGSAKDNTLEVISLAAPTSPIEGGTPQAAESGGTSLAGEATAEVVSTPTK